jgi:hypothetical protein
MTTTKQATWALEKEKTRQERKERRGVPVTIAEVRHRTPCTCEHAPKKHKKTGRCRGKVPTDRVKQGQEISDIYRVPQHLVGVPTSCDCQAGVR